MGIKGLMKLLSDSAPNCYKTTQVGNYMGRAIAIDASMQLYQFMVMVRSNQGNGVAQQLTNENGDITSHIQGFFSRTIRLMEKGLKPVYVFDGKPPEMKSAELAKRRAAKAKAKEELKEAEQKVEEGDKAAIEAANKAAKRTVYVTKQHNADVQRLLQLMGVPIVVAPCEAEAQCAELNKANKVWATATEDMDALTFETPILLRHLTFSEQRKLDVYEISYEKVIEGLGLTKREFVDLCILCGCDYSPSIKGIGPKTALKLIREHKTLEKILDNIDTTKHTVPAELKDNLDAIRSMFEEAEVTKGADIKDFKWEKPDKEGLVKFLVGECQFDEKRVLSGLNRLEKSKEKTSQRRMDSFFKVLPNKNPKRKKVQATKGKGAKKSKK